MDFDLAENISASELFQEHYDYINKQATIRAKKLLRVKRCYLTVDEIKQEIFLQIFSAISGYQCERGSIETYISSISDYVELNIYNGRHEKYGVDERILYDDIADDRIDLEKNIISDFELKSFQQYIFETYFKKTGKPLTELRKKVIDILVNGLSHTVEVSKRAGVSIHYVKKIKQELVIAY